MNTSQTDVCKICRSKKRTVRYKGPIRVGRFGHLSEDDQTVFECTGCGTVSLPPFGSMETYYESHAYRQDYDGGSTDTDFFRAHDGEQLKNLSFVGTEDIRDKVYCDVGCGAGAFLDLVNGYTRRAIAIEPDQTFRDSLQARGYEVFPYASEAKKVISNEVDIVSLFSVIEHIEEPLELLKQSFELMKPGGRLVLTTPNLDDLLLESLGQSYAEFYYRQVHLWYFSKTTLVGLLSKAGFEEVDVSSFQRFGMSNFLYWLRDRAPRGDTAFPGVTNSVDALWRQQLSESGRGDYLVACAKRPGI